MEIQEALERVNNANAGVVLENRVPRFEDLGKIIPRQDWKDSIIIGVKFTDQNGCTMPSVLNGGKQSYLLPSKDSNGLWTPSGWTYPADGAQDQPDERDCGPHRIHIMLAVNAMHAPHSWNAWYALGVGIIGLDNEKAGVQKVCLLAPVDIPDLARRGLLRGANLRGANLQGAYLHGAYLEKAYLEGAYLEGAYLREAYLHGADLRGADLRGADLQRAYLQRAYLLGAYLQRADLRGANLQGADLWGANLRMAYLREADLRGAELEIINKIALIRERAIL